MSGENKQKLESLPALEKMVEFLSPILLDWKYNEKPLVISLSGPQGSGKSYLSSQLLVYFATAFPKLNTITLSTDDLYLSHAEQDKVKYEYASNPLLKGRGLPGTHDVDLAYKLLSDLDNRKSGFRVPRYDKSAFLGEGDRTPKEEWETVTEPIDIVIFEGWFNGFTPFDSDEGITEIYNESPLLTKFKIEDLFDVNFNLSSYLKIWDFVDVDIFYDCDNINNVYDWRLQQEHELIAKRGSGMTDEQVRDFIERYMVVYELYYRDFTHLGIKSTSKGRHLRLKINKDRSIVGAEVF